MPFDPSEPEDSSPLNSGVMRGQFNGLKSLIDSASGVTSVVVDAVNTIDPGEDANVSMTVEGTTLHFTFDLPRGAEGPMGNPGTDGTSGSDGRDGADGATGATGAQGSDGEVSQSALDSALAGTAANVNGVGTLDDPFDDPAAEALRQKFNELILAARR